ncbi:MAG: ComF family protein [Deltaproteobacteria bacterium]|nr:ComF family protein [Candidatus Anaeroferrophillus wilburensis]MBN2889243.1 ComF family protein [Deltaproteobacteria bacterium]
MKSSFGALLLPRRCLLCRCYTTHPFFAERHSSAYAPFVCQACATGFEPFVRPVCSLCGHPFPGGHAADHHCLPLAGDRGLKGGLIRSGYRYAGGMVEIIHQWKYGKRSLVVPLVEKLVDLALERWAVDFQDVAVVGAIPLAPPSFRSRGFNQALIIASRCASRLDKPLQRRLLVKARETKKQASLGREQRRQNLAGVFHVGSPDGVAAKTVMLCDDVMTSGATLSAASEALLLAGAAAVKCFTLCRVERGRDQSKIADHGVPQPR